MKEIRTRLIREGEYLAEVDVELLNDIEAWAPHLSLDDSLKPDCVRRALKAGDIKAAARGARIFDVAPIASASHA